MHLNLARKWRSKHFDEVVGQPLVVRLVKNSLYRNLIFPVYLLSGTRGCGKTSVARIFAAALNCDALEEFQKNPQQQQIPCLSCASCSAMQSMKHPDFIEMDAASHTGVDNVRAIIDAASFVPVLGKKKIYLIDEAHMLSKAAFNAFLKILEEPPVSVVFMLATTDPHKIIETVTSRCFQLFFDPIEMTDVADHLERVCTQEGVSFEKDALMLIAHETEGSMRDALNLVERIRIAYPSLTQAAVIELLGKIDDDRLCELLGVVLQGAPQDVLATIKRLDLEKYNPVLVWKSFVELIRHSLWVKNGVELSESAVTIKLKEITAQCSLEQLIRLFEICYDYEMLFAKTATPAHMLEMMLLKMAQKSGSKSEPPQTIQTKKPSNNTIVRGAVQDPAHGMTAPQAPRAKPLQADDKAVPSKKQNETTLESVMPAESNQAKPALPAVEGPWERCLQEIEKLNDPLVTSIFKQGTLLSHDQQIKQLEVVFSQDLLFFKDWLENTQKVWQPAIDTFFGEGTLLVPQFTGAPKERPSRFAQSSPVVMSVIADSSPSKLDAAASVTEQAKGTTKTAPSKAASRNFPTRSNAPLKERERVVTITDPEKWRQAHTLLQLFPGTLVVSQEKQDTALESDSGQTMQDNSAEYNATQRADFDDHSDENPAQNYAAPHNPRGEGA